jgi:hypothetical protein
MKNPGPIARPQGAGYGHSPTAETDGVFCAQLISLPGIMSLSIELKCVKARALQS